ncbi:hypothetical protein NOR_02573 [Metarhizium rileyi]|uniref:Uncharacterized protein n=1 Tax=Metarhizium rileyi (strain RCEF 4871) TaxID=1649241 RepID=A0A167GQ81_METRR|nr:hypothetical protein NOR_02573 [Metarhizium rileyi RCEF 4871]
MTWIEERSKLDAIMQDDRLLESLLMDQMTTSLQSQTLSVREDLALGELLVQILIAAVFRFSWLLWRLLVAMWLPLYYPYLRLILSHQIPVYVSLAAWLVFLADHDPLAFTIRDRPVGVCFTSADVYQLWYWLAAPILFKTAFRLPTFPRKLYNKAASIFNNALDIDIGLFEHVIECYKPTPPKAPADNVLRGLLRETHLDDIDANIDNPEYDWENHCLFPREDSNIHFGWDTYFEAVKKRERRQANCYGSLTVHRLEFGRDDKSKKSHDEDGERKRPNAMVILEYYGSVEPILPDLALEKLPNKYMELRYPAAIVTGEKVSIDILRESPVLSDRLETVADCPPSTDIQGDEGADCPLSTDIQGDDGERVAHVHAPEELKLCSINLDDGTNELTATDAREKECTDKPEILFTTDEGLSEERIKLETEHICEEDYDDAAGTAKEKERGPSEKGIDVLEQLLANDTEISSSAEVVPTSSISEQPEPIFDGNHLEKDGHSEESGEMPQNDEESIDSYENSLDELEHASEKAGNLEAWFDRVSESVTIECATERDEVELENSEQLHHAIQTELPLTPEPEVFLVEVPPSVGHTCELFEAAVPEWSVMEEAIPMETIFDGTPELELEDMENEPLVQPEPEKNMQDNEDSDMSDVLELEMQEENDGMQVDIQEDCDMTNEPYLDDTQDQMAHSHGYDMDTDVAVCGMQGFYLEDDLDAYSASLYMDDPFLDNVIGMIKELQLAGVSDEQHTAHTAEQQMQIAETIDTSQLVVTGLPEHQVLVPGYDSRPEPLPEGCPNKPDSEDEVEQQLEDIIIPEPSFLKEASQIDLETDRFLKEMSASLSREKPQTLHQEDQGQDSRESHTEGSNTTRNGPPQDDTKDDSQTIPPDSKNAEGVAKLERIFASLSIVGDLPPLNESGFDKVDGSTSFDFAAIQQQEDDDLEEEMIKAFVETSEAQNLSGNPVETETRKRSRPDEVDEPEREEATLLPQQIRKVRWCRSERRPVGSVPGGHRVVLFHRSIRHG